MSSDETAIPAELVEALRRKFRREVAEVIGYDGFERQTAADILEWIIGWNEQQNGADEHIAAWLTSLRAKDVLGSVIIVGGLERLYEIAAHHQKAVDEHGGTTGECTECGWQWPCPTYDWARRDSDRDPLLSPWDRADDEEGSR